MLASASRPGKCRKHTDFAQIKNTRKEKEPSLPSIWERKSHTNIFSKNDKVSLSREQMWELSLVYPTVELCCWSSTLGCHDTCLTGFGSKAENRAPRPLTRKYGRIRPHCRWRLWAMTNRRTGTDKQKQKRLRNRPFSKILLLYKTVRKARKPIIARMCHSNCAHEG